MILLLEDPRVWAMHCTDAKFFIPCRWKGYGLECLGDGEEADYRLESLLQTPLVCNDLVHLDGVASVWVGHVHQLFFLEHMFASAGVKNNTALLRTEDLLFRPEDVADTLEGLGLERRGKDRDEQGRSLMRTLHCMPQALEAIAKFTRLEELTEEHLALIAKVTARVSPTVGYSSKEEVSRWISLAHRELGQLRVAEYKAFDPDDDDDAARALDFLAAHGYVVFRGVADEDDLKQAETLLWDFMTECDPALTRGDPTTWGLKEAKVPKDAGTTERTAADAPAGGEADTPASAAPGVDVPAVGAPARRGGKWPSSDRTGVVNTQGIGQSAFMWHLRGLPRLRKAFARIFDTDDLLSSFDGCGIFRPYGHDASWKTCGPWYHIDQGDGLHGFSGIQGLVTLYSSSTETGGLVIVPGSHLMHEEILKRADSRGCERLLLKEDDPVLQKWSKDGGGAIIVAVQPGDAALWDSRTAHCNTHAQRDAPPEVLSGNSLLRVVGYVSMSPTAWTSTLNLHQRADIFRNSSSPSKFMTTTHLAHELHVVSNGPATRANPVELGEAQMELAISRDFGRQASCNLKPGEPSFLPAANYWCREQGAPVRSAPSHHRGTTVRQLPGQQAFRAYRFGDWLRLSHPQIKSLRQRWWNLDDEWVQLSHAVKEPPAKRKACDESFVDDDLFAAFAAGFGIDEDPADPQPSALRPEPSELRPEPEAKPVRQKAEEEESGSDADMFAAFAAGLGIDMDPDD